MIYDNINRIAHEKGISINKLEQQAGLSRGSICKWNVISPSVRSLKKVADFLGVSIEHLIAEENPVKEVV